MFTFVNYNFITLEKANFTSLHQTYKESSLHGRYITLEEIEPYVHKFKKHLRTTIVGESENKRPIYHLQLGFGTRKVLLWSQMHGNESTTTKALIDILNVLLLEDHGIGKKILSNCTLHILPMLNPDGALRYTRENFNSIDLNRDAQNLSQAESRLFDQIVREVNPDFAFNLHGQRTIFSAGASNNPATISFLSPAGDSGRSITVPREGALWN